MAVNPVHGIYLELERAALARGDKAAAAQYRQSIRAHVDAEQPGEDFADLAYLGVSGVYLHAALAFLGTAPRVELRSMGRAWMPVLLRPAGEDGEILPGRRFVVAQQRQAVVRQEAAA